MEYLFHRHSDLYAGAKGQRRIGGRKTAARVSVAGRPSAGGLNRGRGFKNGAAVDTVAASRPLRRSGFSWWRQEKARMEAVCGKIERWALGAAAAALYSPVSPDQ